MQDTESTPPDGTAPELTGSTLSPWKIAGWVCAGVVIVSVSACVIMAAIRSVGLTEVTVTALNREDEPRDHNLPLVKQKEALPDYELTVLLTNGRKLRLGTKPDSSAVDGLTWKLAEPVSVADVATVRLQERDKVISDAVAEVQVVDETVTERGYRFDFATERSTSVGVASFFVTAIGKAITAGFCIAVILLVLALFCG